MLIFDIDRREKKGWSDKMTGEFFYQEAVVDIALEMLFTQIAKA